MSSEEEAAKAEEELIEFVAGFQHRPLAFVRALFPWGQDELAPTEKDPHPGPDAWQTKVLNEIEEKLRSGSIKDLAGVMRYVGQAIQIAVSSGHGVGKTALICWVILWGMSTMEDTRGVVTANTKTQLTTKTWSELAKWHRLCICGHWFEYEKTSLHSRDPRHEETWRIDAIPWSKTNPEAFAGLHNKGKRIIVIFDEASAIEDIIWETTDGVMTDSDTEIIWLAFGNPTRNTGRFRECWRRFKQFWSCHQVDSRTAKTTNKSILDKLIEAWGLTSDYIKVRVLGIFPSVGERQFIGQDLVDAARGKHIPKKAYDWAPKIISLDNAWTGGDEVVIGCRQGLAHRILQVMKKNDNDVDLAGALARWEDEEKADAVFIDFGMGTGVYSVGQKLGRDWILVNFGSKATKPGYANKRAEMWGDFREALRNGAAIPDDQVLCDEITAPEYQLTAKSEVQLESKDDMKARGIPSPNRADALVLLYAYPVEKKNPLTGRHENESGNNPHDAERADGGRGGKYDPLDA